MPTTTTIRITQLALSSGADLPLLRTLTIFGTVKWDTEKDGLELRACYILVGEGGYFQVGSRTKPMEFLGVLAWDGIPPSRTIPDDPTVFDSTDSTISSVWCSDPRLSARIYIKCLGKEHIC